MTTLALHGMSFIPDTDSEFELTTHSDAGHRFPNMKVWPGGVEITPDTHHHQSVLYALIPTPTVLDSWIMRLHSLTLLYNTIGDAMIEEVKVFDGPKLVRAFPLAWSGSHEIPEPANTLAFDDAEIFYGLVVFVKTRFARDFNSLMPETPYGRIRITSLTVNFMQRESWLQRLARIILRW